MDVSVSSLSAPAYVRALPPDPGPSPAPVASRPILIAPRTGPLPAGADPMALFDSLLVSVDIRGPQLLRSSRYAAQLYSEMQRLLMRLN